MRSTKSNPLNKLKEIDKKEKFLAKVKDKFSFKTFYEKYKSLYKWGLISKWLTPLFSILTGSTFLYFMLSLQVHFIFAFIFSVSVVIGLEFVKSSFLTMAFNSFFQDKFNIVVFSLISVGLCYLSILLSVEGIKTLSTLKNSNDIQNNSSSYYKQKDSITNYYTSEIATAKNELQQFKKQASYRGQINIHNKAVKATILQSGNHIQSLRESQAQELKTLTDENAKVQRLTVQLNDFDKTIFVYITIGIELLIIAVHFWIVLYEFKTVEQSDLVNKSRQEKVFTPDDFSNLANQIRANESKQVIPINENKNIGFGLVEPTDAKTSTQDLDGIIKAIKFGVVDNRILTKYGYNPAQVKALKQEYTPKTK